MSMRLFRLQLSTALCTRRQAWWFKSLVNTENVNVKLTPSNCTSLCFSNRFICSASESRKSKKLRERKRKIKTIGNDVENAEAKAISEKNISFSVASVCPEESISEKQKSTAISAGASERQIKEEVLSRGNSITENACVTILADLDAPELCFPSSIPSSAIKTPVHCLTKNSLDAAERVLSTMYTASSSQIEAQEKFPSTLEPQVCTSSATKCSLVPNEEDYRALLLNLLLFRKETLNPILEVIQEERRALTVQITTLDTKVKELELVRQDIRKLLETHTVQDRKSESENSVFLTPLTALSSSTQENTANESSNNVKCTANRIESLENTHDRACVPSLQSFSFLPQNQPGVPAAEPLSVSCIINKEKKSLPEISTIRKGSKSKKKSKNKRLEKSKRVQDEVLSNAVADGEEIIL